MTESNAEKVLAKLGEAEKSGRLAGLEIEYWVGGGLPPPYYRSDQLRLLPEQAGDIIEFAKLRFDDRFDPPSLNDKWRVLATSREVRDVLRHIREGSVFTTTYPEERNPGIPDLLSTEISVSLSDGKIERRYFRNLPGALAPLRATAEALIERVKREGDRGLYHKGRHIPEPPPAP